MTSPHTKAPIPVAAVAALVSRRTAYRLVQTGAVPVETVAGQRVVDVEALRAAAAARATARASANGPRRASASAASKAPDESANAPGTLDPEAVASLVESLDAAHDLIRGLWHRVEHLEQLLGVDHGQRG